MKTSPKASPTAASERGEGRAPEPQTWPPRRKRKRSPRGPPSGPHRRGLKARKAKGQARVSLCSPRYTLAVCRRRRRSRGTRRGGRPGAEAAQSGRPPVAGERNAGMRSEAERRRRNGGYPKAAAAEPRSGGAKCGVEEQSDTHGEGRGFIADETLPERTQGKRQASSFVSRTTPSEPATCAHDSPSGG